MKTSFKRIGGSVTAPQGFRAAGIAAGIKSSGKKDVALIVSDVAATAAATFTTNQVKAAPVKLSMEHVKSGKARAIVANSGNANACTKDGPIHARAMACAVSRRLGCKEEHVLVCSTGRIGENLPIVKVEAGIKDSLGKLSRTGGPLAAQAIMTTDTFAKEVAVQFKAGAKTFRVGGICKGAGMIQPKMATMLCFITTDAAVPRAALQKALRHAVDKSFNRVSVDGDTSTNDTVILLANGVAGAAPLGKFQEALDFVCLELAKMIVRDGEGVSKFVTIHVRGAASDRDAEIAARSVANSVLVKTSWCGGDPNWGRILDALGYSSARVNGEDVDIDYDGVAAVRGSRATRTPLAKLKKIVGKPTFTIDINLRIGRGQCTMHTCDLTEKYVELNKGE
ncbi:MAG TPA: bifunctional glutamate N-acetyltransferase/amino-acid acetyltransferase ArgJ [Verrucomicrobiae bacterium]|nr:bifunctional glutamate N-acetyltransferase/amino-acid acetyltransferase ArgJ [Verrucomicrobiae bacterium]